MSATILVVDDEQDILELVSIRLEMAGYRTVLAVLGEEGLRSFFIERPDLAIVVIDISVIFLSAPPTPTPNSRTVPSSD